MLTPQETDDLIEIMRSLKEGGTSIVFITHKLREVRAVADRITVIRRGKVVGEAEPDLHLGRAGLDDGRPPGEARDREGGPRAGRRGPRGRPTCGSSTPPARSPSTASASRSAAGEIYALAGVQGNGQTELTEALVGLEHRRVRHGHPRGPRRHPGRDRRHDRAGRRLRARGPAARRPGQQLLGRGEPRARPLPPRAVLPRHVPRPRPDPPERRPSGSRSSTSARRRSSTPPRPSPAATSRRSSSPASCPAR